MAKLLIDPIYTIRDLSKCGTWYWLKNIALDFLDRDENNYVYFIVPKGDKPFNKNDLVIHERAINIEIPFVKDRYLNIFFPDNELLQTFSAWGKYSDWDFVFTTRNNGMFWRTMIGRYNRARRGLILGEPFPFMNFKKTLILRPEYMADLRTITSYLHFDKVFIHTKYERDEILKRAKDLISPAMVQKLDDTISVKFFRDKRIDIDYPFSEEAKRRFLEGKVHVFYPQMLDETERRFSLVYETIKNLYVMSNTKDIDFHIFTNSVANVPYDDVKFISIGKYSREEFWELLKDSNVFISFSIEEGLPFAIVEALMFGNIGVISRQPWSEDLFGKDYPWFFDSKNEATAKIQWISENREKAWDMFIDWYKNYFISFVNQRGDHAEKQNDFITNWIKDIKEWLLREGSRRDDGYYAVAHKINSSELQEIDLHDISLKGILIQKFSVLKIEDAIYSRLPNYYQLKFILIHIFGWKDTSESYVLKR